MTTSFFANCIGVFQGGGVRAAAFAGAYEAAREAGVAFCSVAGTSAGSLAAALIATGAPPQAITTKLMAVNFKDFLKDVDPRQALVGAMHPLRLGRALSTGLVRKIATIAAYGGLHSSFEVHRWLDESLRELLRSQGRNIQDAHVRFRHLPVPLAVVAADLTGSTYAIFSNERTPDFSVAAAVRASCTIPFFFQPAIEGSSAYVDGGVLSNLPAFLFANAAEEHLGKYSPRVLGFRLVSDVNRAQKLSSVAQLGEALANTVVDGALHIQQQLQPDHHSVTIGTGTIKATDFDAVGDKEKIWLVEAGRKAVAEFIKNERNFFPARGLPTTFVGRDQLMLVFVHSLLESKERFVVVDKSSHWLYLIFPAFLAAARRGVRIDYITAQPAAAPLEGRHEAYRQRLLRGLGARISTVEHLPFRGFLVDPALDSGFAALTHTQVADASYEQVFQSEETRTYSRQMDPEILQYLIRDAQLAKLPDRAPALNLELQPCDEQLLFQRLQRVPQYREARFSMCDVPLDGNVQAVQTSVKEFKCLQIDGLVRDFAGRGIQAFMPQQVLLHGGMTTIVTPPVLERHGSLLTLIEGHTRTLHCLRQGSQSIRAVVVEGVTVSLPASPRPLSDLTIASRTLSRETQYEGLNRHHWREIEQHVHPVDDGE